VIKRFSFEPEPAAERSRLDHFLAACELELSRSQIKRIIEEGDVSVKGVVITKPGHKLRPGDRIEVRVRPPVEARAVAQAMDLVILHEDPHIIVIDKPAGLVVHPAPGHPDRTLVNALLAHCTDLSGVGGELRPGIVHRLDKDTSGVMVATKSDAAHSALAAQFKRHDIEREYLAVVSPPPRELGGTFATLHGRHPVHRKKFSSRVTRGKPAVTHYRVEDMLGRDAALVRCRLETGRTHQIRVHFADHGAAVVGDPLYGRRHRGASMAEAARALGRQALHAAVLGFAHPITHERLRFESSLPEDMRALIATLRAAP
jgi:23S rRNA pseudouridine1911/1915/1917 synthase